MRDIKFRVWDKERKKMHYNVLPWQWDSVICTGSWKCIKSRDDDGSAKFEVWVQMCDGKSVMQYTGLNDKNGKEIYEGDIVEPVPNADIKYEVVWNNYNCGFWLVNKHGRKESIKRNLVNDDWWILELFIEPFERVVIGNIYENPELLEGLW